jgi:hypothetical protein
MEKRILEKWMDKDENGQPKPVLNESGQIVDGAVNITNVESFSQEMQSLMDVENVIPYEKLKFEELNLQTAKVKDLMKLEFLFD